MHCDEFENRLNDLLDRRITPDDDSRLRSHARHCPECAESMADYSALAAALKNLLPERPDESFPLAVMDQWSRERTISIRHRLMYWAVPSLTAAAALLIAMTLWRGKPTNPNSVSIPTSNVVHSIGIPSGYDRLAKETQQLASLITTRQLEVMNELVEGIKPVTASFGAAYDALRRTMPGGGSSKDSTSG
ncbi:MAG: zf-HC2 domain-containing protein [Pirellulales bacterium]|nr:zf-HC2 domain-containing protein [Pirellulales bacterium]